MIKSLTQNLHLLLKASTIVARQFIFTFVLLCASVTASIAATITSFAPASGAVGTLVTVNGKSFTSGSTLTIGGQKAIVISLTTTQIVGMVMPGAVTGKVTVNISTNAASNFTITETPYPTAQQGRKITDVAAAPNNFVEGAYRYNAKAVALSADGNTAIISGQDASGAGAAIYTRQNGRWQKVSPFINSESWATGISVAISADGSTAVIGGFTLSPVPVLVLRKVNGSWSQPRVEQLANADYDPNGTPPQWHPFITGNVVSITADGKTIVIGSGVYETAYKMHFGLYGDGVSIFNRDGEGWKQVPTPAASRKFLGIPQSESPGLPDVGATISADGKTMALIATHHFFRTGKNTGYFSKGYTIIYSRATKTSNTWVPQQLLGEFSRVQLSADGNTLLATGDAVNNYDGVSSPGSGVTIIYTRNGTTWSLAQTLTEDGEAVISADGSTIMIANNAAIYTRVGGSYIKKTELKSGYYAASSALSADGSTALVGNPYDSGSASDYSFTGAIYAFSSSQSSAAGVQASDITYTGVASLTGTTMGIGWTNGSGTGRAVFMKQTAAVDEPLPDDRYYKNKAQFKTGEQIGTSGWYCVYNGTGNSAVVQNLVGNAAYRIAILEYGGTIQKPLYLPLAPLLGAATPQVGPPLTQASALIFSNRKSNSGTLKWTNGSGVKRAVFLKLISWGELVGPPSPEELIAAGNTVGPYENYYGVWRCVYNGTGSTVNLTGLLASAVYTAAVLEYNEDSDAPKYLFPAATTYVWTADEYKPVQNISILETTGTTANLVWGGAGARFSEEQYGTALFVKLDTTYPDYTTTPSPANVYYSANARFGSGNQIGTSGWYCVYNGPSSLEEFYKVKITGLTPGKLYDIAVVTYSGPVNAPQYIPGTLKTIVLSYLEAPTGYATGLAFSNTAATSTILNWTNSNGSARAVFLKLGTSGALNIVQQQSYTANNTFGLGTQAGTNGWYCVYNGTGNSVNLSGLSASSTYRAIVIEYNGTTGEEAYNLSRYNGANVTTTVAPAMLLITNQKRLLEQDALADNATPELTIHQGLSPNGDGDNDVFTIDGIGAYPQNTVKIMNSNGDVVYNATGYDNALTAFNGHATNGTLQKAGTYFYWLEYKKGRETIRKTGYLVIKY